MLSSVAKDHLPEVLVVCYQDPIFCKRCLQHAIIIKSTLIIKNRNDFVPLFTKPFCNPRTGTLVNQKTHYAVSRTSGMNSVPLNDSPANSRHA